MLAQPRSPYPAQPHALTPTPESPPPSKHQQPHHSRPHGPHEAPLSSRPLRFLHPRPRFLPLCRLFIPLFIYSSNLSSLPIFPPLPRHSAVQMEGEIFHTFHPFPPVSQPTLPSHPSLISCLLHHEYLQRPVSLYLRNQWATRVVNQWKT
ncbi:hypothetical protein E2C01_066271 [Portunus trituberculatus]|uniref:Uncharacterized protein n=1 Tax=Portunus trituberculatus TaxID=210409 RepID=A0A5B7HQH3_PORTR|nr:hypothetical protein [Portunus trituberculatus]